MTQTLISSTTPRIHGSEPRLLNRPALIDYKHLRFLVSDAPSDSNLPLYVAEFERHAVKDVVRVCDPTYGTGLLNQRGIQVYDWPFNDGEAPPAHITNDWLRLVGLRFGTDPEQIPKGAIAIHCVAGLGRAPLLVAIALIEAGMAPEESVDYVRTKRRGALNSKQMKYVREYRRKSRKRPQCCIL
ncbi:Protein tyrosine phosphatase type IVA 1 [Podila clonocystis]|nr:Protein tyrosine phosphatase type IVA 1 [Podila clonocystis]